MRRDPRVALRTPVKVVKDTRRALRQCHRRSGRGPVGVDGDAAVDRCGRVGEVERRGVRAEAVDADGGSGRFGSIGCQGGVLNGDAVLSRRDVDLPHGAEDRVGDEDGARVSVQRRCAVEALGFGDLGDEAHRRLGRVHINGPKAKGPRYRRLVRRVVARDHGEDVVARFGDTEEAGDAGDMGQECGRYG